MPDNPEEKLDLITLIAQRGRVDDIVKAAESAGATGVTYFEAKGTGVRQKLGLKGFLIVPDKQVFLIVTKRHQTDAVFEAVSKAAHLDEPAKGFAYIHPIDRAVGFLTS